MDVRVVCLHPAIGAEDREDARRRAADMAVVPGVRSVRLVLDRRGHEAYAEFLVRMAAGGIVLSEARGADVGVAVGTAQDRASVQMERRRARRVDARRRVRGGW